MRAGTLWKGRGVSVLFVMATAQEYGAELQRRIAPLITGVGPVAAAAATSAALGALTAIEESGRAEDIVFASFDGSPESVELIKQGKLVAYRYDGEPVLRPEKFHWIGS